MLKNIKHIKDRFHPPVLVFSLPKTGSSSIFDSLRLHGYYRAYHLHNFFVESYNYKYRYNSNHQSKTDKGHKYYEEFLLSNRKVKIITLVRDPLAQMVSEFFEMNKNELYKFKTHELIQKFKINLFKKAYRSEKWFENQFRKGLNIDVFAYPFEENFSWKEIKSGNKEVIILKTETPNRVKEGVIKEKLGLKNFVLNNTNTKEEKDDLKTISKEEYKNYYRNFLEVIEFTPKELDEIYNSKFSQFFFSEGELKAYRNKWNVSE